MHRNTKILISALLLGSLLGGGIWLLNTSEKKRLPKTTKTETPIRMDIIDKRVISGNLVPCKEVALKTEMEGILDKLYVAVGDQVTKGMAIAGIKVLPKSIEIETAKKAVHIAQITQAAAAAQYQRSKQLFDKEMLSLEKYEQDVKAWKMACTEATYAQKKLDFVLKGYIAGAEGASNTIKSTLDGIVSELPCKEGSTVMGHGSFKEGSTIATISDMSTMIFKGKVGEMEVAYLHPGMQFEVSLMAIKGKKFPAVLTKIAPKALASEGDQSIKFAVEGTVQINSADKKSMRVGYTATADIVLDKATNVLAIKEQCVHTDELLEGSTPFVWVYENNKNVRRHVVLGVSDGIYVEAKEGLTANDQVIIGDDSH